MAKTALPPALLVAFLFVACMEVTPAADDPSALGVKGIRIEVITPEGTSIRFIREKPRAMENMSYRQADAYGVLTLKDGCLRLEQGQWEGDPVIIWPPNFTPRMNDGVLEIRNAMGQVVAKLGEPLSVGGAPEQMDAAGCSGPIWVDTQIDAPAG